MCATRKNNPKHSHSNGGRPTGKALLDKSDLQHLFRNYPELLDAISCDPAASRTFKSLVSDGCAPGNLLLLVTCCVWGEDATAANKKDLDAVKDRLDRIIRRLKALETDVRGLSTMRISGEKLGSSAAFHEIDVRAETTFARDFLFRELPNNM